MSAKLICSVTIASMFSGLFQPSVFVSQVHAEESVSTNPVLLEESFDGYETGTLPPNWISDVNEEAPLYGCTEHLW